MAKILGLTPCLMQENNRDVNKKSIKFNIENLNLDAYAVFDQCFEEEDFNPFCTYIGHATTRIGWNIASNTLLDYFYNSDYDYAFWIDANSVPSKSCLNDLTTIIDNIKNEKLFLCDTIYSTFGMWISQDRITYKKMDDYFDNVHIIPAKMNKSYNWMHGLFMKNYNKFYSQKFYVDERCDVKKGTSGDVYFSRLLRRYTNSYVAPTIVINKPSSKTSCDWSNSKGSYDYPVVLFDTIDSWIVEDTEKYNYHKTTSNAFLTDISLPRNNNFRELIKPYSPRNKSKKKKSDPIELF